jgi:hypothetical protein
MPDIQNFRVTRTTNQTMSVPRWIISFQVTDERTGALLRDFTGANSFLFPTVLGTLSQAQQDRLVERIVQYIIEARLENA